MKSINAKKIAAVTAGAALLGIGLAFAGPVTFDSVQIISNSGQPLVQIVVGSAAKPSDGVAAANIAAAIGNLAYTTVPVTASVNATQAASVLHVSVTSSNYTLVNPQVWLNESGVGGAASGTFGFSALIGSVLNGAVPQNPGAAASTKTLQGAGTNYAYPESPSTSATPYPSPYVNVGVPLATSVTGSTNGGGVSFSSFSTGSNPTYDNILKATPSGLLSDYGPYGETENLWVSGFPVYDQNVHSLALLDANLAYQVVFDTPINVKTNNAVTNAAFSLLGQNYTTYNFTGMPSGNVNVGNIVTGGKLALAQSMTPLQTVYVGHNITSGPFTVQLQDLSYPNGTPAAVGIYYNGQLTNESAIPRSSTEAFNVSGHTLYVHVGTTFAGLYAYEKWAKIQLFSNIVNLTSGQKFNSANPNYYVQLEWTTNATSTSGPVNELKGITIYGSTANSQTLLPGQSMAILSSPAVWKLTFIGQTLSPGTTNFDQLQLSTSTSSATYQNPAGNGANVNVNATAITEPVNLFTVTSQIPNAFSFAGQTSSTLNYNLDAYGLVENANFISSGSSLPANALLIAVTPNNAVGSNDLATDYVSTTYPLTVEVTGYNTQNSLTTQTVTFTSVPSGGSYQVVPGVVLNNVTNVEMYLDSRAAVPYPGITANVLDYVNGATQSSTSTTGNTVELASLQYVGPELMYTQAGKNYDLLASPYSVTYSQPGQLQQTFTLAQETPTASSTTSNIWRNGYFTYTISEYPVPASQANPDSITVDLTNSTVGISGTPFYYLNATGTAGSIVNNVTYTGSGYTGASSFNVGQGFITERGSQVASIGTTSVTLDLARSVDMLQFAVGPANKTISTKVTTYGPYGIGQATNIPNVTVANIKAGVSLTSASKYTITGISNLTATPSITTADQPVLLSNLPTNPLVVLDTNANPASTLILIGSGYVNTLSAQLQKADNITISPTMTSGIAQAYGQNRILIAGYYANQTTAAANSFIEQLYKQAASS
ncbi:MAG: beta strand repeat-containing protein [Candidatus Micrarchaeia archaeon]